MDNFIKPAINNDMKKEVVKIKRGEFATVACSLEARDVARHYCIKKGVRIFDHVTKLILKGSHEK